MNKLNKIKWFMFVLKNDGVPEGTLSDGMDLVELYCILVLFARIYKYVTKSSVIPLELSLGIGTAKYRYATSKRGVERKRLQYLKEQYDSFLFKWESDPLVKNVY